MKSKYKIKGFKGLADWGLRLKAITGILKTYSGGVFFTRFENNMIIFSAPNGLEEQSTGVCPDCYIEHFNSYFQRDRSATCFNGHRHSFREILLNPITEREL